VLEFEVTDLVEARRARIAQYHGVEKSLKLAGLAVSGVVTSVLEDRSQALPKWIVKVRPAPERKVVKKSNLYAQPRSRVS
jgi:hypothetical protein